MYDENVLDYWRLPNGIYKVKLKKNDGLEGCNARKNTLPSQSGVSNLCNSKRVVKVFLKK